jgi:hypothetical protein
VKRTLVLTSTVLAWAGISLGASSASAAPGDAITVTGTVQQERADGLVVRGADGATYFADLRRASGREDFDIGEPVRLVGHEGRRPGEIIVSFVEPAARAGRVVRGAAPSGDALELDGWVLPRSHVYQVQDDRGVYYQLPPQDIPGQIRRGKEVYDLTARAWVNHPTAYATTDGRNPAYTRLAHVGTPGAAGTPGAPGVAAGEVIVIDGWRLPLAHFYKAQDDRGVYHPVPVQEVPSTILRGKEVYDVTAQAWVNHPTAFVTTSGRNPAYLVVAVPAAVPTGDVVVIEGWRLPRTHIYQVQDQRGVYYQIQPREVPGQIYRGGTVYDLTTRAWVNHPTAFPASGGKNPFYTATADDHERDRGRGGWRSDAPSTEWREVRGTVERVQRDGVTLRTDDGWSVAIDLRGVGGPRSLTPGERVVVVVSQGDGRLVARQIALERGPR